MSVSLRPVTASDEAFLFTLYASSRADELAATGWPATQREMFLRIQWMAQGRDWGTRYPKAEHQVVLVNGRPVGRRVVERGAASWLLLDISLLPTSQKGGVGTGLLRELQDEATRADRPLRLHVLKHNPARRLYARLGFEVDPTEPARSDDLYLAMRWTPPRR